jgi:hypothetical protein
MFPEIEGVQQGIIYYRESKYFFYVIIYGQEIIDFIVHELVEKDESSPRFEHVSEMIKINLFNALKNKIMK